MRGVVGTREYTGCEAWLKYSNIDEDVHWTIDAGTDALNRKTRAEHIESALCYNLEAAAQLVAEVTLLADQRLADPSVD